MDDSLKLQKIFNTLGDANRLRIIQFIGNAERSVSEIVRETGMSQPLVSHHLGVLRKINILETDRKGPFIYHRLKDKRILDVLGLFLEMVNVLSDQDLKKQKPMFCMPKRWKDQWLG